MIIKLNSLIYQNNMLYQNIYNATLITINVKYTTWSHSEVVK